MKWSDDFKIGIGAIDAQHRRLFELLDQLESRLQEGLSAAAVKQVVESLEQYTIRHFRLEEKYMSESGYDGLDQQQQAHRSFCSRVEEIKGELDSSGMTPPLIRAIRSDLSDWIKTHVTGLDRTFGDYFQSVDSQES